MNTTSQPEISVLIATHNRRELIRRCLETLADQTQDAATFEAVVVVDGATDGTTAMLREMETPFELRVFEREQGGQAAALNAAIEAARAPVCLFIDDDVVASPQLLEAHLAGHKANARTLGIGSLTQQPSDTPDWYAHAFARSLVGHYEELSTRPARWDDCYGANFSAPRAALLEVEGFATDLPIGDDFDIAYRLCELGLIPTYLPTAYGVHDDQKLRPLMLSDARRQGLAHVELSVRHPGAASILLDWRGSAPPAELRLRRLLVALHVPLGPVAALGALVPADGRKVIYMLFVRRFAFWRTVREITTRSEWKAITRGGDPAAALAGRTSP